MPDNWLGLGETAELLGVHPSTVRNWADQGLLPVHRTQGGHRRFLRDELELWTKSQRVSTPGEAAAVVQSALSYTRVQISEGHLESQGWYQKLDQKAREAFRRSSRALLQGLTKYLASDGDQAEAEARAVGYDYASLGRRYQLSASETTEAFLFFRGVMLDSMVKVFEAAAVSSAFAWGDMLRKINTFTDHTLLSLLKTYEAFTRGEDER